MKHRVLGRVCLLTLIGSVGCAEATQGPDPSANVADGLAGHAGVAGNPFRVGTGSGAGAGTDGGTGGSSGSASAAGASGNAVVASGGLAGASSASGGSFGGKSQNIAGGGSPSLGGGAGSSSLAGSNSGVAGSGSSDACAPRTFSYPDSSHVLASVGISGSFNAWDKTGIPLTYDAASQSWKLAMTLAVGTYQYKFVVNGSDWKADPDNSDSVGDGFGGVNSVVVCQ